MNDDTEWRAATPVDDYLSLSLELIAAVELARLDVERLT